MAKKKSKKRNRKKLYELNHAMPLIIHTNKLKNNLDDEKKITGSNRIKIINERLTRDYEQNPIKPK